MSTAYRVRRLKLRKTDPLDRLARASGALYSQALVSFWRVVRKKEIWLSPTALMKLFRSNQLHSQSAQATLQVFCASLKSWRQRRKRDPYARPPRKCRRFFKVIWKSSAIHLCAGSLHLSNGKGNEPLVVPWKWTVPKQVEIGWQDDHYELRATYCQENEDRITGDGVAGIDLGEIHPATTFDGKENVIYNGRLLRSKRQYQNKLKARLAARLAPKQQGSRRWRTIKQSKDRQLRRLNNQLRDIQHKLTRALVSTLLESGVQTLVIGDVRDIRTELNYGKKVNQKLHQWTFGQMRHMLSYKWEALGGAVVLHEERGTSSTCPRCRQRRKPSGRVFRCPCGFFAHRDAVGSINIRNKYQDFGPVVGAMAPPLRGVRFHPHLAGNSAV